MSHLLQGYTLYKGHEELSDHLAKGNAPEPSDLIDIRIHPLPKLMTIKLGEIPVGEMSQKKTKLRLVLFGTVEALSEEQLVFLQADRRFQDFQFELGDKVKVVAALGKKTSVSVHHL